MGLIYWPQITQIKEHIVLVQADVLSNNGAFRFSTHRVLARQFKP